MNLGRHSSVVRSSKVCALTRCVGSSAARLAAFFGGRVRPGVLRPGSRWVWVNQHTSWVQGLGLGVQGPRAGVHKTHARSKTQASESVAQVQGPATSMRDLVSGLQYPGSRVQVCGSVSILWGLRIQSEGSNVQVPVNMMSSQKPGPNLCS